MDLARSKKFLMKMAALYFGLAVLIYAVAYPQFRYHAYSSPMPSATMVLGEAADGREIRQGVSTSKGSLNGFSLMVANHDSSDDGELRVKLENSAGVTVAEARLRAAEARDNGYTRIELTQPVPVEDDEGATLIVSCVGFERSGSVALYAGRRLEGETEDMDPSEYAQMDGEPCPGRVCLCVNGQTPSAFYRLYPILASALFLVAAALCKYWWKGAVRGDDNPLATVCLLATRYRLLLRQLISRDFKTKYKRSVLGMLWSFLNPLLTMAVQYIVFSTLFKSNIEYYPVYLLTGIVFFNFFNEAVNMGMTSIVGNASLIKKVYVPKYIFPVSRVVSSSINFFLALIPLALVMLATGVGVHPSLLLLAFDILCYLAFIIGVSLLLATSMTFFQDTQFLWTVVSMIWMYLTPIFYPESIIAAGLRPYYRLNPLYQFIGFARTCIMDGVSPEPAMYLGCIASAGLAMLVGSAAFKRHQDRFVLYL